MKVWVFVQRTNGKSKVDVFRSEASAKKMIATYVRVNWPAGVNIPDDPAEAFRLLPRIRRELSYSLREVAVA